MCLHIRCDLTSVENFCREREQRSLVTEIPLALMSAAFLTLKEIFPLSVSLANMNPSLTDGFILQGQLLAKQVS